MKKILLLMTMILTCVGTWAQTPVVHVSNIGTAPFQLSDTDAAKIFELDNLTVVLDVTTAASLSGRGAFFCVADPAQPVPSSFSGTNTSYMACGHNGSAIAYLAAAKDGQHFSTGTIPANSTIRIAYVFDKTNNKFKSYIGDTNTSWTMDRNFGTYEIATPKMVKEDFANANIYIGGGMAGNAAQELGDATIHRVRVYSGALTVDEIKKVDYIKEISDFENGNVYTFVTSRGWMGAKDGNDKVISTAYTANGVTGSKEDPYFQWTVYQSSRGNYYLYNLGKGMFMGKESSNNTAVPFVQIPVSQDLTFKKSSNATYPIMFSTDGAAVVNHSANHASGLISWTGGWNTLDDDGSNHQVTLVKTLTDAELKVVADRVAEYEKYLYVKVEVEDWDEQNPNTHFGCVTATLNSNALSTKLTTANMTVSEMSYNGVGDVISFTRPYRGFTFQGFYLGEQSLGESFTLTEAQKNAITEAYPLVAKFTTTDDVTLFYDDDPKSYRIPAITTTSSGRVIAVSDYRHNLDDIGRDVHGTGSKRIDLVMRYSDDNGATWSEKQTIAEGTDDQSATGYDCAYGDAAIAAVGENVLVMAAAGNVCYPYGSATSHNRTVRLFSADNGKTWSKEDISERMFISSTATIPNGHTAFFGSGKLAVDPNFNGTGNTRIYGGMLVKDNARTTNVYVVYTDDLGQNWKVLGGVKAAEADEPKVEILPNGQILLSARRQGGRLFNVFTYGTSDDDKANGTGTWSGTANGCNNGGSNGTNGEIFLVDAKRADGTAVKLLMQSQPKGGSGHYDRKDVTIWYKEVDANTTYTTTTIKDNWTEGMQVSYQQSSYSVATLQADGRIGFFFEEAPCYDDDQAKGYCMVYTPLTIESITKVNYFSPNTDLNAEKTINVELTDAQGNIYREQVECLINNVASDLKIKYPYITLGDKASLNVDGDTYTYTNTVELPFKVSNANTTVWHNIYWPANTKENAYPVYLSASAANDTYVPKVTESAAYGNSSYNTADNADKISWAIYNVDNGFTFKFKNKLTGKYIQVTSVATGNAQNAKYVDEASATAFEIVPDNASYKGDYTLKASVGGSVGYLCSTSATGYHYATHYSDNEHQGAWVKFVDTPDFVALIADINESLDMIGTSLGLYKVTDANATKAEAAKAAMQNSGDIKLNVLNDYSNLLDGATLNMPKEGQFFRVAYDYGNSTGKLYLQSLPSSVKGVQFTVETGNTSIWLYHNGALYSYKAGQCLREVDDDRGLQAIGGKTDVTFRASSRAKGKYTIQCTSYVHANSSGTNHFTDHCSSDSHSEHDLILEEVTTLPVTIGTAGASTLYAPVALTLPELSEGQELKVYTAVQNGEYLTLTEVESVIPANTGVILMGTAATYNFTISDDASDPVGQLTGTVATMANPNNDRIYTLQKPGDAFMMKKYNGDYLNGFKAYYEMPANSSVQALRLSFGETTGIDGVVNAGGKLEIYDMSGRRVEKMTKGLYIVNGQKVLVK